MASSALSPLPKQKKLNKFVWVCLPLISILLLSTLPIGAALWLSPYLQEDPPEQVVLSEEEYQKAMDTLGIQILPNSENSEESGSSPGQTHPVDTEIASSQISSLLTYHLPQELPVDTITISPTEEDLLRIRLKVSKPKLTAVIQDTPLAQPTQQALALFPEELEVTCLLDGTLGTNASDVTVVDLETGNFLLDQMMEELLMEDLLGTVPVNELLNLGLSAISNDSGISIHSVRAEEGKLRLKGEVPDQLSQK